MSLMWKNAFSEVFWCDKSQVITGDIEGKQIVAQLADKYGVVIDGIRGVFSYGYDEWAGSEIHIWKIWI